MTCVTRWSWLHCFPPILDVHRRHSFPSGLPGRDAPLEATEEHATETEHRANSLFLDVATTCFLRQGKLDGMAFLSDG
jgi:hypothetical protein